MQHKRRHLIASATNAEIPIIKYLQKEKLKQLPLSNRDFDLAHSFSDKQVIKDYSDRANILDTFNSYNCDFLIPGSNDFSLFACVQVANELGLPGFDCYKTTTLIHYKNQLRDILKSELKLPFIFIIL